MIAKITPEEQYQNRLEHAYSDILHEMDTPVSYTMETNRYDVWRWDGEDLMRNWVALSYSEAQKILDDSAGTDQLLFLIPHVAFDDAAWFFACMYRAGQKALSLMQRAEEAAKLPDEPKPQKARKPRAPKAKPAKDLCACEVHA